ncbi:hypothetical protein SAMD00019534_032030 [Acytostelium subglobosum LB1]|uniref:hypothetical protein n=1 Tax=Acytostelium subglobosum LB1 TaxID=1410327 RepID=UPI000644B9B0|nr:hypothetical protein SAMD00019534_032030 [Acytostelium subglobosum LB1]GAM20028.1 hypothetical protein SAMD00019534_032030 [Acytostelium subglobosum LB1]|eukprot:XP_012756790.1 hypothetical protein SAMD00019534_032030 [Acytostelium subglobosum LB1]
MVNYGDSLTSSLSRLNTSRISLPNEDDDEVDALEDHESFDDTYSEYYDEIEGARPIDSTGQQQQQQTSSFPKFIIFEPYDDVSSTSTSSEQQQQQQQQQHQDFTSPSHKRVITRPIPTGFQSNEERLRFKSMVREELTCLEQKATAISGDQEIYGFCECSLLSNHMTTGNMIITSQELCFMPKEQSHTGYAMENYLNMKGDFFWRKHWFVLNHDSLSWYRTSDAKETYYPNGVIPLRNITSIHKLPQTASRPFCLEIGTDSQIYVLEADSEVQVDLWFNEIGRMQKNLTLIISMADIVNIEMDVEAAMFYDSIYITTKRGENFIITPVSNPEEVFNLLQYIWSPTLTSHHSDSLSSSFKLQTIEFQKIFRLNNQRVHIIAHKTCLLFNDDLSYEGNIYLTDDGLYFSSQGGEDSVVLIIPATDITSISIDPREADSPEAIKVITKDYEVFNFDLIEDHERFYDNTIEAFTKINQSIAHSKHGLASPTESAPVESAKKVGRWRTLTSFIPVIPKSLPLPIFRSRSNSNLLSPHTTTPQSGSTSTSPLMASAPSPSLSSSEADKTILIQKQLQPNLISKLHNDFPSLPLNEKIVSHQSCTLYYSSTNTFVEGHIFVTKSYIAFSPNNNYNQDTTSGDKDGSKSKHMKALIPFEDVVSVKKERSVVFYHCIKVITSDHKWIFGSIQNFYGLYQLLVDTHNNVSANKEEGIFTPSEAVKIKHQLGLPTDEPLITWYNCTNFRGAQLKYGVLYITKHFVCFRSKFGIQRRTIVIPFNSVTQIQRHSTLIPNALKITTHEQDIVFSSFLHRGQVYNLLLDQWKKNKAVHATAPATSQLRTAVSGSNELPMAAPLTPQIPSPETITPIPTRFMRITILTIGSRGDIQPYLALAKAMKTFGHQVTLASHELYRDLVTKDFGLNFRPLSGDPKELMDLCVRNGIFTPKFIKEALSRFRQFIDDLLRSCTEASHDAEALIATPGCFAGPHIAQALQIPFFHSFTMPFHRTRMYPNPFAPFASSQLGGVFNLATHIMMEKILWQPVSGQINQWRTEVLKLPAWNSSVAITETYRIPYLYCYSKHLVPKPIDWGGEVSLTGYWFLPETNDKAPPETLVTFLDQGSPPIYIGFGSIVIEDPDAMSLIIAEAVKLVGRRAIISQGWGGLKLSGDKYQDIYLLDQPVSHSWLFEKVSMVVHHGGAGTTAQGILSGKPTLIVPFFGDQFFWGERIQEVGIGKALSSKELSAKSMSNAILSVIDDTDVVSRVKLLSTKLRDENGLKNALDSFHRYVGASYIPPTKIPIGSVSNCANCKQTFGLLNQMVSPLLQTRFNCSNCGKVFCEKCASNKVPLPKFRMNSPTRVCDPCLQSLNVAQGISPHRQSIDHSLPVIVGQHQ